MFQVNDQLLWEKTIAIPNDAAVYDETISLNKDITEGDTIYFHLHNHGNNSGVWEPWKPIAPKPESFITLFRVAEPLLAGGT